MTEDIKLICGDCLEVMKEISDESIDLIVTDPPYLINYHSFKFKYRPLTYKEVLGGN